MPERRALAARVPSDSCDGQEPTSLLVLKLYPEKKLLITSLPPPAKGSEGLGLRRVTPSKSPGSGEFSAAGRRTRCWVLSPQPSSPGLWMGTSAAQGK